MESAPTNVNNVQKRTLLQVPQESKQKRVKLFEIGRNKPLTNQTREELEEDNLQAEFGNITNQSGQTIITTITSYVPAVGDDDEPSQDILNTHLRAISEQMKRSFIVLGGNTLCHYPNLKITAVNKPQIPERECKFLSCVAPTKTRATDEPFKWYIRRGVTMGSNQTILELREDDIAKIIKGFNEVLLPYLRNVNGVEVSGSSDIPSSPEPIIIKRLNTHDQIILRVDPISEMIMASNLRGRKTFTPNVSLRLWSSKNGHNQMTSKGFTLSSGSFHLFCRLYLERIIPLIENMFGTFYDSFNDVLAILGHPRDGYVKNADTQGENDEFSQFLEDHE